MRQSLAIAAAVGLVVLAFPLLRARRAEDGLALQKNQPAAVTADPAAAKPLANLDLTQIKPQFGIYTASAGTDLEAELTVDPQLQALTQRLLEEGKVPEGAILMSDVATGRVLTWAYTAEDPRVQVPLEAAAPAASVFKIVTGTALLERGLGPRTKQCYSGGLHSIRAADLVENPKRDTWCATLTEAMGRSLNTVFARLAHKNLGWSELDHMARRFGWNRDIPFDVEVEPSKLDLPRDELGFARTAAGFWHSTMSPFQGLNLAMTIANQGEMVRLQLIKRVIRTSSTAAIYERPPSRKVLERVITQETAAQVGTLLEATVSNGTAYESFRDRNGRAWLPNITVAGKTGTLTRPQAEGPFYTWFVGYAPAHKPTVAISVLAANRPKWHTKATQLAAKALRGYFAGQGAKGVSAPISSKESTRR
jgi:peptidoglycan glycosyltransferase